MQLKLGQWAIFPAENKLVNLVSQEEIRLESKSMAALKLLIDSQGEVVGIEDFINNVWQGRVVGNHVVYRVINQIRKSLNPDDKNAYIINIPKQGYKLIKPTVTVSQVSSKVPFKFNKDKLKFWMLWSVSITLGLAILWQLQHLVRNEVTIYNNTLPLTTDIGNEKYPYFSPDGNYVAYTKQSTLNNDSQKQPYHVFILDLETQQELSVTDTSANDSGPVLSADARRLVFIRRSPGQCRVMLIENPLIDSKQEYELFECNQTNMDLEITGNGQVLYYTQATPPNNQHKIFAFIIDTGKATQLTTIKNVNSQGDRIISLAPNNKKLAFFRDSDWKWSELGILDLRDYKETFYIKTGGWFNALAWTPDSKEIIYQDSNRSLSVLTPKSGRTKKITSAFTEDILNISHNAINSDLAISFGQKKGGIYIKPNPLIPGSEVPKQNDVLVQSTEVDAFPSFANHSKRMAFMSKRSGSAQIWLKNESGEERQITQYSDKRSVRTIRWSPDDTKLLTETQNTVSYIDLKDRKQIILIAEDEYGSVGGVSWDHDGGGVYFSSEVSGDGQIYHLDIASKVIKKVTRKGGVMAFPGANEDELYLLKPYQAGLLTFNLITGEEQIIVPEINSALHRSIQVKPSGIYFVTKAGQIKKFDHSLQQTIDINVGAELMVPVLSVSNDERWFAFPYYNKVENSIYLLSH